MQYTIITQRKRPVKTFFVSADCNFNCLTFYGICLICYAMSEWKLSLGIKGERSEFILTLDSCTNPKSSCLVVC
jgi:hypothetical protein